MKPDDLLGPRWTEEPPRDPNEARVAERLRRVPVPPPLDAAQVKRIAQRLETGRRAARRLPPRAIGLMALAVLMMSVGARLLLPSSTQAPAPSTTPPPPVTARAGAATPGEQRELPGVTDTPPLRVGPVDPRPVDAVSTPPHSALPSSAPSDSPAPLRRRPTDRGHGHETRRAVDDPTQAAGVEAPPTRPVESGSTLAEEQRLLAATLRALRGHDGGEALSILDEYGGRFPAGVLVAESRALRVHALLMARRGDDALALLDGMALDGAARNRELRVVRGELRAQAGRLPAAESDFTAVLGDGAGSRHDELEERARYGRASCRARRGDAGGAREDLRHYMENFPSGRFAAAVREALAK